MHAKLTATEKLAHCTVRLVAKLSDGTGATGTGFFFAFGVQGDRHIPAIVTNRHVVEGVVEGGFHLTLAASDGGPARTHQQIMLTDFGRVWIWHPDPTIDLAVMPIAPLLRQAESQGLRFSYAPFTRDMVVTSSELDDLSPAEDVLMVGYPNGIWDEVNNFPVFRRGIAATHPGRHYNGKPEFVIDAACFPGSSGSPILLYNSGMWMDRSGNAMIGGRLKLLGILYGGPIRQETGQIKIVPIPTTNVPVPVMPTMINLGFVVRAEKLLDFEPVLQNVSIVPPST